MVSGAAQDNLTLDQNFLWLREKITQSSLPPDLGEQLLLKLRRLEQVATTSYRPEYDLEWDYINFITSLPFNKTSQDLLDIKHAIQVLDKNHYGLKVAKDRILEYLAVLILNRRKGGKVPASILALVGLVGSGKTSLAYSIAEALGRKLVRVPLGGLGGVAELRGQSRSLPGAQPGQILKGLGRVGCDNPVILLDEIDRVAQEARSDVMGVLVELLDPEQNRTFLDHYVDYPFDLSKALFLATANNTANIATAVLDRLEIIEMPAYSDEEKIIIGRNYLLPEAVREAALGEGLLKIEEDLWPQIVRPLGYDAGIRSLQRTVQKMVRKVARSLVEGHPGPYVLTGENIGQYLE